MQRGSDISVSFSNGDRFGAVATASGLVKVYKNSTLLATVDVTAWPYYASGGYIGLWMIGASGNVLDDFGGGTIPQGSLPGGSLTAWWERVKDWIGQVSGGGKVAAPAALKSQMAIRQRELTLTDPPAGRIYRSYYFVGSVRVAMREFTGSVSVVSYILTDHLGSTSMILDSSGVGIVSMGYKPWGELRYPQQNPEFGYKFTGQMQLDIGIYHYGARQYDPLIGRFLSADTYVPESQGVQAFDRYAYVNNNPVNGIDPTGHMCSDPEDPSQSCENGDEHPFADKYLHYTYYKGNVWASLPKASETRKGLNFPGKPDKYTGTQSDWDSWVKTTTSSNYEKARRHLFINGYGQSIDGSGKINDVILVAIVNFLEFGDFKDLGPDFEDVYEASLSAMSYQYAVNPYKFKGVPICGVMCIGVSEQLVWLQAFHVMRADIGKAFSNNSSQPFAALITDAARVTSERFGVYSSFGNGSGSICAPVPHQTYCVK